MISPVSDLLASADLIGWEASSSKARAERSGDGQFFTPSPIAKSLAAWFEVPGLNRPALHLLDPGAGGGVLTAAAMDRVLHLRSTGQLPLLSSVTLEVWELDPDFIPSLRQTLAACEQALAKVGVRATVLLNQGDYIEGAARALDPGLFGSLEVPSVTHAILNPPYRKITTDSRARRLLASLGIETSNLYSAFVSLALRQLARDGELVAITPRSFCNGPYFRSFRQQLLHESTFLKLHLFDSRSEAFGRDKVLQENILFHLSKRAQGSEDLFISTGSVEQPVATAIPRDRFVSPSDPDEVMHIAPEQDASGIREFFDSLPCTLRDLGIEVSTGPVVDFRLKPHLLRETALDSVPLLYPHHMSGARLTPPLANSADYNDARLAKKPVAIRDNEETRKWLLPTARFVLIKRFSSKEEKRRLVAAVLDPADFKDETIGLENHLNYFHRKKSSMPDALAQGLCRFLNSTIADRYFRQFNGHTQVNASDLRSLRYPDLKSLERLGQTKLDDSQQAEIDLAMLEQLGAALPQG